MTQIKCDIFFNDESDRKFYDTAKTADSYLVTGNIKHFPNDPIVITPAKCIELLNK